MLPFHRLVRCSEKYPTSGCEPSYEASPVGQGCLGDASRPWVAETVPRSDGAAAARPVVFSRPRLGFGAHGTGLPCPPTRWRPAGPGCRSLRPLPGGTMADPAWAGCTYPSIRWPLRGVQLRGPGLSGSHASGGADRPVPPAFGPKAMAETLRLRCGVAPGLAERPPDRDREGCHLGKRAREQSCARPDRPRQGTGSATATAPTSFKDQ